MNPPRHFLLKVLCAGFLLLALAGCLRFATALAEANLLERFGIQPGVWYLAAGGALWGLVGLAAVALLWIRPRWATQTAGPAAAFFFLSYWADRLFFVRSAGAQINWVFALLVSTFLVCLTGIILVYLNLRIPPDPHHGDSR